MGISGSTLQNAYMCVRKVSNSGNHFKQTLRVTGPTGAEIRPVKGLSKNWPVKGLSKNWPFIANANANANT